MKGNVGDKGKLKHDHDHAAADGGRGRDHPAALAPIDDTVLRDYLADALSPEQSARVEKALRDSAELRARLEEVPPEPCRWPATHTRCDLEPLPFDVP